MQSTECSDGIAPLVGLLIDEHVSPLELDQGGTSLDVLRLRDLDKFLLCHKALDDVVKTAEILGTRILCKVIFHGRRPPRTWRRLCQGMQCKANRRLQCIKRARVEIPIVSRQNNIYLSFTATTWKG